VSAPRTPDQSYRAEVVVEASRERVFEALATLDGLAGWWTPDVRGSTEVGGKLTFGFGDECIVMRIERRDRPVAVAWTCLAHSRFREWQGTEIFFDARSHDDGRTRLSIEHAGLIPDLGGCYDHCSRRWDHFLGSIAGLAAGEGGSPWQPPNSVPAGV